MNSRRDAAVNALAINTPIYKWWIDGEVIYLQTRYQIHEYREADDDAVSAENGQYSESFLMAKTKPQLLTVAADEFNLDLSKSLNKAAIVAAILTPQSE